MDTLVLVHCLEFGTDPHALLREAVRVLAPEGHLLILAFNPMSLWGIGRMVAPLAGLGRPWAGHYYTALRLRDWCRLLGLEHREQRRLFFRPPIPHPGLQQRLAGLERVGSALWPMLGGVNLCVSRKRVPRAIPMGALLRRQKPVQAARPVAGRSCRCAANDSDMERQ